MFHKGQHVACIDDSNYLVPDPGEGPTKGRVYTIASYDGFSFPVPAVSLHEFPPKIHSNGDEEEKYFKASRFRPLTKLKVEDFTGTLAPVKADA